MRNKKEKKKKFGFWQWIVFGGIFPIIIVLSVLLAIFSIRGVNIFEEVEKIPVIGSLFTDENSVGTTVEDLENTINDLQAELKNEEAKATQLQSELETKENEIAQLQAENERLEQSVNELQSSNTTTNTDWDSVVKTYETMKPKDAALILVEMDEATALNILAELTEDQLADILEKMSPEEAAQFTDQLADLADNR
ncbi:MotE family protein [Fervidibacillus albus]|uniref:MotE family protein n=1 Tax=Fervidibacillus albus TaxID=2980026 RepID=A0A9E8LWA2_9BACI|nr:MotE family protein [Fervidibacillus albus]WAA10716.1 MotE family protein [Fervidibacillus albus]